MNSYSFDSSQEYSLDGSLNVSLDSDMSDDQQSLFNGPSNSFESQLESQSLFSNDFLLHEIQMSGQCPVIPLIGQDQSSHRQQFQETIQSTYFFN